MRFLSQVIVYVVICCSGLDAFALQIKVSGGAGGEPPVFNGALVDPNPLELGLQLFNEENTDETIFSWQLSLRIVHESGVQSSHSITGVTAPAIPFFTSLGPGPNPPLGPPFSFGDADIPLPPMTPGKLLASNETRDIATIEISNPNEEKGDFYVVLDPISSVWFVPPPPIAPMPMFFTNMFSTELPSEIIIAKLSYPVPEPAGRSWLMMLVALVVLVPRARAWKHQYPGL